MPSRGVIQFLLSMVMGKQLYLTGNNDNTTINNNNHPHHCHNNKHIFLDTKATKEAVIQAGIAIFQYIYYGPDTTLGEICYNMFSRKAVAGVIKPESLPPTKGAVAQHALLAYTCRPRTGSFY